MLPSFNYKIIFNNDLTETDHLSLIYLYQPLIGSNAVALYLSLVKEANFLKKLCDMPYSLNRFAEILNVDFAAFELQLKQLATIKLLNLYIDTQTTYVLIEIINPLAPELFIKNDVLVDWLKTKVSEETFDSIFFMFQKDCTKKPLELKKITPNLQECFNVADSTAFKIQDELNKLVKTEEHWNNEVFIKELKKFSININPITIELQKEINEIRRVHLFSEFEIALLISKVYNYATVSYDIADLSKVFYQNAIDDPLWLKKEKTPTILAFKLTHDKPNDFCFSMLGKNNLEVETEALILELTNKFKFSNVLINSMLYFSFAKNGYIVTNYVRKLAETFENLQINSLQLAVNHYLKVVKNQTNKNLTDFIETLKQAGCKTKINDNASYKNQAVESNQDYKDFINFNNQQEFSRLFDVSQSSPQIMFDENVNLEKDDFENKITKNLLNS